MLNTKWSITLSNFFFIPAAMSAVSLVIAYYFHEVAAQNIFLYLTLNCSSIAVSLYFSGDKKSKVNDLSTLTITSVIGWLIVIGIALIPFLYIAYDGAINQEYTVYNFRQFENALFEATSGITSTGLSVTIDSSQLPKSLQWWRSLCEWIGGLGILIFASSLMRSNFDTVSDRYDKDNNIGLPTVNLSSKYIGRAYVIITLLTFSGLYFSKINTWEAINHALTSVSTGGFSITGNSLKPYSLFPQLVILITIVVTSLNFNCFKEAWMSKSVKPFINHENITYFVLFSIGLFVVFIMSSHQLMIALFQSGTALGTAGFSTTTIEYLDALVKFTLIVLMFIGGTSNSTAGGIKVYRVVILFKFLWSRLRPTSLHNYDENSYSSTVLKNVFLVLAVWVCYYLFSTVALYTLLEKKYSFVDILFESTSALSSVGLSSGIISSESPAAVKYLLCLNMYLGRLEMLPLLWIMFKLNALGKHSFLSEKQ